MFELTSDVIDPSAVRAAVTHSGAGAVLVFHGNTRDYFEDREVTQLSYEAYAPMAIAEMKAIARDVADRWPGARCAMVHRLGIVPPAETSIVIAVSTAHRGDAYAASRFAIDELKTRVPIWKKEIYSDGSVWKANAP